MKSFLKRAHVYLVLLFASLSLSLAAGMAWAQDAGVVATAPASQPADPNVGSILAALFTAVSAGNWWVVASIVLTVVVWLLRKYVVGKVSFFTTTVGGWAMNFGLALLGALATAFMAGKHSGADLFNALVTALKVGAGASTLYTLTQDVTGSTSKPTTAAT